MRCEGLPAVQAADFSIGGNGGKVKQPCAPGTLPSGPERTGTDARACGKPCPDTRQGSPGHTPAVSGRLAGPDERSRGPHQAGFLHGGTCAWGAAAVAGPGAAVPLLPVMSGSLACPDAAIIRDAAGGCRDGGLACAAGWATKKAPCGHGASGVRDRGPSRRSDRSRASRPGRSSRAGRAPGRPRRTRPGPR